MSKSFLSTNQELRRGDCLVSNDGNSKAVFQEDGNFVIYKYTPVWGTNTSGDGPHRVVLQCDCNLVMYDKNDVPVWAAGYASNEGNQRVRLTMTNEGKLEVENNANIVWKSQ